MLYPRAVYVILLIKRKTFQASVAQLHVTLLLFLINKQQLSFNDIKKKRTGCLGVKLKLTPCHKN